MSRVSMQGLAASAILAMAGAAEAAPCSGYDALLSQSSETLDLGGGNTLTVGRNHSMQLNDGGKTPDHLTIGECNGTFLNYGNGTSEGQGYCLRKDKDGDTYWLRWAIEPGAKRGTFQTLGGTGKFAKISNKGWWEFAAGQGKFFATRWGGDCSL
jgi:hypothetical protein